MTPQSSFVIVAPLDVRRVAECRTVLASLTDAPGRANPANPLVPFGRFERLHFARFVVIDDPTQADITLYGLPPANEPEYLAFLGDVDGDLPSFLRELADRAGDGLRTIFSFCEGFTAATDLVAWMRAHHVQPATTYANWRGRTVLQVREEASLHDALRAVLAEPAVAKLAPRDVHTRLRAFTDAERAAGRLTLTPERATPAGWWWANLLHLIGVPVVLVVTSIPLLIAAVAFLLRIRALERTDPELCPRAATEHVAALAVREDRDVTNQFSAIGSLKPGVVRRWTALFVLWIVNYLTRHVFVRGRLARVHTIQFAHWIMLDGNRRMLFISNYDGSLDSYMDDFINKVAYGLNLVFSNGTGYPRARWLVADGAKDEQKFKNFIRRHQLATEVWYNAHPGLTAVDLERNARVRAGLDSASLTDQQARDWVALL